MTINLTINLINYRTKSITTHKTTKFSRVWSDVDLINVSATGLY